MSELSVYIKEKRASRDLSIRKLGELANISHTEIKRIEDGVRKQPSPQTLRDIAAALNVPYDEIMTAAGYVSEPYYHEIADDYRNKGDFNRALEYYQKALTATLEMYGEEHKSTAMLYAHIGAVYFELCQYGDCLMFLTKSLEITEKLLGEKHPETVALYNNIAMAYKKNGEGENAEKYLMRIMMAHELGHSMLHLGEQSHSGLINSMLVPGEQSNTSMVMAAGIKDADDLTESELDEVNNFIAFIKNKRKE